MSPSSFSEPSTPFVQKKRAELTMRAIATIQRRAVRRTLLQCVTTTTERFGNSQTCYGSTQLSRLLSSARPLPDDEDAYQWSPNSTRKSKTTPLIPLTIPGSAEMETTTQDNGNERRKEQRVPRSLPPTDVFDQMMDPFDLISPTTLTYTGDAVMPITSTLQIVKPQDDTPRGIWPVFRLMVSLSLCREN
jgi:hypothetical protein